jgi:hypothetical protein
MAPVTVSSINKTDWHDIAEILLKVALNTTTLTLSVTEEAPSLIMMSASLNIYGFLS